MASGVSEENDINAILPLVCNQFLCAMKSRGDASPLGTVTVVVGYGLCSSLLAVINKYAITYFPYPGLLTALQYATSVVGVLVAGKIGLIHHDPLVWGTAKKFLPAAFVFYLAIFTNTNLLKHANVDTFIVFRSSTPVLVALADTFFRKQALPSGYTFASLIVILAGAVGYVITDSAFTVTAYTWAFAYLITICTEMVYIKHMVTDMGLNTWGFVLYNNFLSLMLSPFFLVAMGEYREIAHASFEGRQWMVSFFSVGLSCLFGLAISFFGFAARKAISATAFTVTGVVNKLLTVVINVLIWDKHASFPGLVCLLFTIVGGVLYQQSTTMTKKPVPSSPKAISKPEVDEEQGLLSARHSRDDSRRKDRTTLIAGSVALRSVDAM